MPSSIAQKLKIKDGERILLINDPGGFKKEFEEMKVKISNDVKDVDQIHWFVKDQAALKKDIKRVTALIKGEVKCWIYYPKSSSGKQTDLTRDKGWDPLQAINSLQWLSLISFDDTWSAFALKEKTSEAIVAPERVIKQYITADKQLLLPEDFKKALKANKEVSSYFDGLAFSHRKEYLEWIVTAKKEETRKARLDKMITMLEAKKKNPASK